MLFVKIYTSRYVLFSVPIELLLATRGLLVMGGYAQRLWKAAGQPVVVAPVSLDRVEDRANAEAFIAKRPPLAFYAEPKYALPFAFKPPVDGLPTTLLIDRDGVVRARLSGGADWSGAQARRVIEALATGR